MSTKRPTMVDVAARAGVSLSTVSLAFSGVGPITPDTKAKVDRAAAELGYTGPQQSARALRSGRTDVVGVVIHEQLALSFRDPFALRVMDSLIGGLGDLGLGVLLIPTPTGAPGERSLLNSAAMDVAVVMHVRDHADPTLELLRKRRIPTVIMEGPPVPGTGAVTIDDRQATVELIRHLQSLGHERIATVTLPFDTKRDTVVVGPERLNDAAWMPTHNRLSAFADAGIEPCVIVESRASMVEEGIAAGHLALSHESRPTAVLCQSDMLAAGVVLAARELDLDVPGDVSVTGFDGIDVPWLGPDVTLTTVLQDGEAKGQALAAQVRALLEGAEPGSILLPLTLQVGSTTGPVRA